MRRTITLKLEVVDEDAYVDAILAIQGAVRSTGNLLGIQATTVTGKMLARLRQSDPTWRQYSGSVHRPT